MRTIIFIIISVFLIGCSNDPKNSEVNNDSNSNGEHNSLTDENKRKIRYKKWSNVIGPQFWPFSLKEYEDQKKEFDVVNGLGGRWISSRNLLREDFNITRAEMVTRIRQSFEYYGWEKTNLPERKYVLSAIYETSKDDLHFTRGPFSSSDTVMTYKVTIHISDDASVLVLYCEAVW